MKFGILAFVLISVVLCNEYDPLPSQVSFENKEWSSFYIEEWGSTQIHIEREFDIEFAKGILITKKFKTVTIGSYNYPNGCVLMYIRIENNKASSDQLYRGLRRFLDLDNEYQECGKIYSGQKNILYESYKRMEGKTKTLGYGDIVIFKICKKTLTVHLNEIEDNIDDYWEEIMNAEINKKIQCQVIKNFEFFE